MKTKKKIIVAAMLLCFITCCHGLLGRTESSIRSRVVRISGERGMCSGEQVNAPSGESYILTAAHCKLLAKDGQMLVTRDSGTKLWRRIIAEDPNSDLLLLEGLPKLDGLDVGRKDYKQHVRTFTHGNNHDTYKTEGYILEIEAVKVPLFPINSEESLNACKDPKYKVETIPTFFGEMQICALEIDELVTTAMIVPGSSGGAVVDDQGNLVGVVSAGNGNFGFLVSLKDINNFLRGY